MAPELSLFAPRTLRVTVAYSAGARDVVECSMMLPEGADVAQAISQSGVLRGLKDDAIDALLPTIWGRKVALKQPVQSGDRIELLRALKVDPKVARRERFVKQGAKSAGLFTHRRTGSKAGY